MSIGNVLPFPGRGEHSPFLSTHVTAGPHGGWVTILDLGDGATLSKWFSDEGEARAYPKALVDWLNQRRGAL